MIRIAPLLLIILFLLACKGQKIKHSPFNDKDRSIESADEYSFLIGGHLYGKQNTSYFPANTLTVCISEINQSNAAFFIGLGDIVRKPDSVNFSFFNSLFTDNLRIPFYNAVGNHDVMDRDYYESVYGNTYFHFYQNGDLFVFLDTELDSARISGKQLLFLKKVLNNHNEKHSNGNVFVFMHKLIWNDLPGFDVLKDHSNQIYTCLDSNYYEKKLLPLFIEVVKPVFIFSGDIGTPSSYSLFYHKDDDNNITYIANGIGDGKEDALIKVNVGTSKTVSFEVLPLTETRFDDLHKYDIEYWKDRFSNEEENSDNYFLLVIAASIFLVTLAMFKTKLFTKNAVKSRSQ